jgi:hypothetical protein
MRGDGPAPGIARGSGIRPVGLWPRGIGGPLRAGARAEVAVDGRIPPTAGELVIRPSSTQLTEARDRLHAEQAERRRREDDLDRATAAPARRVVPRYEHLHPVTRPRSGCGSRAGRLGYPGFVPLALRQTFRL